ncbi:MAG: radical SAM protein [Chloroflexota bacterium]
MARPEYVEVQCKSAINRVHGMPFNWSLNPYVGCAHRCHYCYARAFYVKADHGNGREDFDTRILVKTNLPDVLRRELARPSWAGESVAMGTATDVYQPAEGRFRVTRRVLEVFTAARNPIGMITKSPMVYRDIDVLTDLARNASVRVLFTITTIDGDLARTIEPGTAHPRKRLQVMRALNDAGIPAGILLAPILPGVTDSAQSIESVAREAVAHGAQFFGYSALRLGPVVREHYLDMVDREFPELKPRYERAYVGRDAPAEYTRRLAERVEAIRDRHGLAESLARGPSSPRPPHVAVRPLPTRPSPQLALPL